MLTLQTSPRRRIRTVTATLFVAVSVSYLPAAAGPPVTRRSAGQPGGYGSYGAPTGYRRLPSRYPVPGYLPQSVRRAAPVTGHPVSSTQPQPPVQARVPSAQPSQQATPGYPPARPQQRRAGRDDRTSWQRAETSRHGQRSDDRMPHSNHDGRQKRQEQRFDRFGNPVLPPEADRFFGQLRGPRLSTWNQNQFRFSFRNRFTPDTTIPRTTWRDGSRFRQTTSGRNFHLRSQFNMNGFKYGLQRITTPSMRGWR